MNGFCDVNKQTAPPFLFKCIPKVPETRCNKAKPTLHRLVQARGSIVSLPPFPNDPQAFLRLSFAESTGNLMLKRGFQLCCGRT